MAGVGAAVGVSGWTRDEVPRMKLSVLCLGVGSCCVAMDLLLHSEYVHYKTTKVLIGTQCDLDFATVDMIFPMYSS